MKKVEDRAYRRIRLKRRGVTPAIVVRRAARIAGVEASRIRGASKVPKISLGRSLACKWLVEDLGLKAVEAAKVLRITQPAVSNAIKRGKILESKLSVRLEGRNPRGPDRRIL